MGLYKLALDYLTEQVRAASEDIGKTFDSADVREIIETLRFEGTIVTAATPTEGIVEILDSAVDRWADEAGSDCIYIAAADLDIMKSCSFCGEEVEILIDGLCEICKDDVGDCAEDELFHNGN